MGDIKGDKFSFYMYLMDKNGNHWGTVSVIPIKKLGKRDIILSDSNNGNFSFRSITELINTLMKRKVSFEVRKNVLEFLADSFLFLEQNGL